MAAGGARIAEGITGDGAGHGHPLPRHGVGAVPEGGLQVLKGQLARPSDTGLARTEHMASRLWAITSRPVEAVTAGGTV